MAQLFVNHSFDSGLDGWSSVSAVLSVTNGDMTVARNNGQYVDQCYQDVRVNIGETYTISAVILAKSDRVGLDIDGVQVDPDWLGTDYAFTATNETHRISINPAGNTTGTLTLSEFSCVHQTDASIINHLLNLFAPIWSNKETIAQANPQPVDMFSALISPINNETVVKNNPFYADPVLDQKGEQRKYGYIESTTKINDIPVANKRVVIVANDTLQIIYETISDEFGNYRFDSLLMSKKYMITAQFGNSDENTPPEYSAVSADWQTPTEY